MDSCISDMAFSKSRTIRVVVLCLFAAAMVPAYCRNLYPQRRIPVPPVSKAAPSVEKVFLLKMRVEDGRITADITNAPLQHVLKDLADRTGIVFEVRSHENPPVSIHLQRVPLQEAIQRIASGNNAIFYYGQGEESGRITMVRLFSRTKPGPQPGLLYLGTGQVTKTGDSPETPEQALQVLASNASIEEKEIGIEVLAKNKSEAGINALIEYLADAAPELRSAAIDGLAAMGAQSALPEIIGSLQDEHPGVRHSAATAVAMLGDARNLKDLRPLKLDKDPAVSAAAETAIRKLEAIEKR